MSLSTLIYAYLLGGITFIPLLLVGSVAIAWFALPEAPHEGAAKTSKETIDESAAVKAAEAAQDDKFSPEGAASASFAVLRSYNFSSALAALNAKSSVATSGSNEGASDGVGQESVSVYQSMYRSVFDRSKTALNRNTIAETEDPAVGLSARAKSAAAGKNVFYIVLRHGHLMLYDSPAQLEVRHVISLAHHSVSLSDGDGEDENITDGDLFVKRTAILLNPLLSTANGAPLASQPKPFYLFSSTCSEKEDFYYALLAAQSEPPIPQPLDSSCAIKLQSTLHSTFLTPETRALNALISRMFLALHRTPYAEQLVRSKIERKISRVQKPAFITSLAVQSIDLGDAAPILSNPRLKELHISGDMVVAMDCKYTGGMRMVISAVAKLDLGPRFKVRTVDLVLAGILQRLQGRLLIRIKPPPSNRIWFCFDGMPDMDLKIEPVVSSRQITYTFILRAIENRIREVVAETLVKPNWDDIPFFKTAGQTFRGGIWQREPELKVPERKGTEGANTEIPWPQSEKDSPRAKNEKTMSMPILPKTPENIDSRATSSGSQASSYADPYSASPEPAWNLKRRSVMSLPPQPAQLAAERVASVPRPIRSPSFASPAPSAPSEAVDGANVDAVRGDNLPRTNNRWISRATTPTAKRDAADVVREVRDRSTPKDEAGMPGSPNIKATTAVAEDGIDNDPVLSNVRLDEVDAECRGSDTSNEPSRNASVSTLPFSDGTAYSTSSRASTVRTDITSSSTCSNDPHRLRGKNLLAATAAATTAARQWTWNAMASRNKGLPSSQTEAKPSLQEPMGRGQPLPPPGVPLPGPQVQKSTLWGSSGFGNAKKKPALPPRRTNTERSDKSATSERSENVSESAGDLKEEEGKDEFGPWRENHGKTGENNTVNENYGEEWTANSGRLPASRDEDDHSKKKVPPPLPPRRKQVPSSSTKPATSTTLADSSRPAQEDDEHDKLSIVSNRSSFASSSNAKPKLLARNTDRSATSIDSNKHSSNASDSLAEEQEILAIPAPVHSDAEEHGKLELQEGDGMHVIEAEERRDGDMLQRNNTAGVEDHSERVL